MTWVVQKKRTWAEWVALRILKVGPIPTHLAVIMDGNRRYARREHKDTLTGHTHGFNKLTEMLGWCRDLGITHVTAYSFSVDNFKRSKQEVDGLMELANNKFEELLKEREKMDEHGVCVKVIGDLSLLPARTRQLAAQINLAFSHNTKCCLTLAMAYSSHREMSTSMETLEQAVEQGQLLPSDISEKLIEECLYTRGMKDPELLFRTSGEVRLSDFLLWQTAFSCLYFSNVLWPELTIWHLFGAIFYYQRHHHTLVAARNECLTMRQSEVEESDLDCCRAQYGDQMTQDHITEFTTARTARITAFIDNLSHERLTSLKNLSRCSVE